MKVGWCWWGQTLSFVVCEWGLRAHSVWGRAQVGHIVRERVQVGYEWVDCSFLLLEGLVANDGRSADWIDGEVGPQSADNSLVAALDQL